MANNDKILMSRFQLLGDSTENWTKNSHKVLLKNEPGIELLANGKVKFKIGDGVKSWGELPYFGDEVNIDEVWTAIKKAQEDIKNLQDIVSKLSVASGTVLGLVKSSTEENKIKVLDDGTMEVNSLNVNKLVQTEGEDLILFSGDSNI